MNRNNILISLIILLIFCITGCLFSRYQLTREIVSKRGQIDILNNNNSKLNQDNQKLKVDLLNSYKKIKDQNQQIAALEARIKTLTVENTRLRQQLASYKAKITQLTTQFENIRNQLRYYKQLSDQRIIDLTHQLKTVEQERDLLKDKNQALNDAIYDADQRIAMQNLERERLLTANQKLTDDYYSFKDIAENTTLKINECRFLNKENQLIKNIIRSHCIKSDLNISVKNKINPNIIQGRFFMLEIFDMDMGVSIAMSKPFQIENSDGLAHISIEHERLKSNNYKLRLYYLPVLNTPEKNELVDDERLIIAGKSVAGTNVGP